MPAAQRLTIRRHGKKRQQRDLVWWILAPILPVERAICPFVALLTLTCDDGNLSLGHETKPLNPVLRQRLELLDSPILLFLVRQTIGRILGVQAVERLMRPAAGLSGMPYLMKVLETANIRVECTHGLDVIPAQGRPAVVCATHATGVLDFVLHMQALRGRRDDIMVVATADAMAFKGFADNIIPVPDREPDPIEYRAKLSEYFDQVKQALRAGKLVFIFPSGGLSRKRTSGFRDIRDKEWKTSAASVAHEIAHEIGQDISLIPAHSNAEQNPRYYRFRGVVTALSRVLGKDKSRNFGGNIAAIVFMLRGALYQRNKVLQVAYADPSMAPGADFEDFMQGLYDQAYELEGYLSFPRRRL